MTPTTAVWGGLGILIIALSLGFYTQYQRAETWQAKHDKAISDCNARTEAANNKALADAAERARVANEVARDTTKAAEAKVAEGAKSTTKRKEVIRVALKETPVPATCAASLHPSVRASLDQARAEANAGNDRLRAAPDG